MNHRDIVGRQFLGKISGFSEKQQRNYEQRHLRAYLRGDQQFQIGVDNAGFPVYNPVRQNYFIKAD